MSDWKIGLNPAPPGGSGYWVVDVMNAQMAWRRLSKPAREAVEAAYPDGELRAHPNTVRALERHGFITMPDQHIPHGYQVEAFGFLTDAGKAVARWCVKP